MGTGIRRVWVWVFIPMDTGMGRILYPDYTGMGMVLLYPAYTLPIAILRKAFVN